MEMRTDKFMIYVFSAIMLGGMVACSSDDPETDTGNGNGNGGNAEAPYVWGAEGAIKTCDHLLFDDDKTENAKGTVIGNGDQEFIFKGTQTLSKGNLPDERMDLCGNWVGIDHRTGDCYQRG